MSWTILSAFLPVFAVIAIGYGVRASGLAPRPIWAGANAINHRILLPALMISLLSRAEFGGDALLLAALSALGSAILIGAALMAGRLPGVPETARAPVVAVVALWNPVLTVTLITRLLGEAGAVAAMPIIAPGLLIGTATAVAAFAFAGKAGVSGAASRVMKDPVFLGCLIGLAVNFSGLARGAGWLLTPFDIAGSGATAVVLLALGAGLDFSALKGRIAALAVGAGLRCGFGAALFLGIALVFGLSGDAALMLALAGAAPGAAFTYALATDFKGDAGFTAGLLTLTVIVSAGVSTLAAFLALLL
ncbi:MAG: hypothetical protein RIA71_08915 [Oceanicaulis sp.]